jgi:hypothetical protein
MNVHFTSDYQSRVLQVSFPEGTTLASVKDIAAWKQQWLDALKSWHSPYKALIDLSHLQVVGPHDELKAELAKFFVFLKGFFLQRVVGFGALPAELRDFFPFTVHADLDEANKAVGLRQAKTPAGGEDLRQQLHFDNHFPQRVIELTFTQPVCLDSKQKLEILKSKLLNVLMQWHSTWTLLIDCSQLEIPPEHHGEFSKVLDFFRGFFMQEILGYGTRQPKEAFPFPVYRARHIASAKVKSDVPLAGDTANCSTRKTKK